MSLEEFRADMEVHWRELERLASKHKDGNLATHEAFKWYEALTADQRSLADYVLAEWVLAGSHGQQFDALALIDKFRITSAIPALERLVEQLGSVEGPEARFLDAKVKRFLDALRGEES
jgi:hypothetical protein